MRLMRLRPVWTTNLAAALLGGGMYALFLIVPEFVEEPRSTGYGLRSSVVAAGLFLLPLDGPMLVMSLQARTHRAPLRLEGGAARSARRAAR